MIISGIAAAFITAGVANLISDIDFGEFVIIIAIGIFFGAFFLSWFIIEKLFESAKNTTSTIIEKVNEQKEMNELKHASNSELRKYKEAKTNFQYFSNDRLLNLYELYQTKEINSDIEQLALGEELVKRKLIEYSPMHEKLYLFKKKFFE